MLKLISQFDDEKVRPSVATPTCDACCCCCCCCLITTICSAAVTSRVFGQAALSRKKPLQSVISNVAPPLAFLAPKEPWYAVLSGSLILPLCVLVLAGYYYLSGNYGLYLVTARGLIYTLLAYVFLMVSFGYMFSVPVRQLLKLIIITVVLFLSELLIFGFLVLHLGPLGILLEFGVAHFVAMRMSAAENKSHAAKD